MPGSIAKEICCTGAVTGDGGFERHGDLTNGLSGAVLFLASNNVGDCLGRLHRC
jgi:hypothetical protein